MTGVRHHSRPAQHLNAQGARALTRDAGVGKGSVAVIVQRAETQPAVSPRSCGERETGEAGRVPASWQGQHERVAGQSWRCGKAAGRRYGGTRLSGPNPRISRNLFKVPSVQPQSHRQVRICPFPDLPFLPSPCPLASDPRLIVSPSPPSRAGSTWARACVDQGTRGQEEPGSQENPVPTCWDLATWVRGELTGSPEHLYPALGRV
ncbi:uncharacterized protein LOC104859472 isoform X2 [Fukomys damarensis]|uniref:uncharacterized protein LOC104859472 isoform X2 n=1 Tax=Fukomys damarensis TaxID=885580 RepID=UPI00053F84D2|nr:uncharacterized protein LOC104859472 isoform X2 [Fukomys damarensis]